MKQEIEKSRSRLAYTLHPQHGSKKVPAGANFVMRGIRCVTCRVPGSNRFEIRTIVVSAVMGDHR